LSGEDSRHAVAATVFLSPGGERAFTIGYSSVSTWDGTTGQRLSSFDLPPHLSADPHRSHSPDGRYALSFEGDFGQQQTVVWDVTAGRRLHTLSPPKSPAHLTSVFSPDSTLLVTRHAAKETVIHVWDVRTGKEVRSFPETKAGWPGQLFFTADGKTLIVAGLRTVGLDAVTGKELFCWRMEPVKDKSGVKTQVGGRPVDDSDRVAWRTIAVSPEGAVAACILWGGSLAGQPLENRIVLCEARTGKVIRRWSDSCLPVRSLEQLAFSPDGRLLASSDGDAVHLWEVATCQEIRTFQGHRGEIGSLGFSAD